MSHELIVPEQCKPKEVTSKSNYTAWVSGEVFETTIHESSGVPPQVTQVDVWLSVFSENYNSKGILERDYYEIAPAIFTGNLVKHAIDMQQGEEIHVSGMNYILEGIDDWQNGENDQDEDDEGDLYSGSYLHVKAIHVNRIPPSSDDTSLRLFPDPDRKS